MAGVESENLQYFSGKHYIPEKYTESSKNSLISFPFLSFSHENEFIFLDGNSAMIILNKDLENNFALSETSYYDSRDLVEVLYDHAVLKKSDAEPLKILDRSCNQYQLFVEKNGEPETDANFSFCIDEANDIDNVSFLIKQKSNPVKGLILAVGPSDLESEERIVLTKITPINSTIKFDAEKELALYKAKKDSLEQLYNGYDYDYETSVDSAYEAADAAAAVVDAAADYSYYDNYMNQPEFCNYTGFYDLRFEGENSFNIASTYISNLCSYSFYMKKGDEEKYKKFALKEIKTVKKNYSKSGLMSKNDAEIFYDFLKKDINSLQKSKPKTAEQLTVEALADEAVVVEPSNYEDSYDYEPYVEEYVSSYTEMSPETSDYATTNLGSTSSYWKGIPKYCQKIDTLIPNFKNTDLKNHAKNYAGQICDMYLGEFNSGVWYKGTLDAIRAEQLYFNNNKDQFSKKDQELLDEFLNSLD